MPVFDSQEGVPTKEVVQVPIGEQIRQRRRQLGVPVARLAEALHVDEVTVWRWETGRSQVPEHDAQRAAQMLGARLVVRLEPEDSPAGPAAMAGRVAA